jgi:hypothetical protein
MLKKLLAVVVILSVLILTSAALTSAQAPTAYYVGFQIQNLSTTNDATVVVSYYKQDGTGASTDSNYQQTIIIPAGRSKTVICSLNTDYTSDILAPALAIRGATSFVGSVIISSDQPIVAIANEAASVNNPYGSASYTGLALADLASTVYAPMITQIGLPNTTINVQNPNSSPVTVTVQYIKGVYGNNYTAPPQTLPPYGSAIWSVPSGALDVSGRFLGSAKITSTGGNIGVVIDAIYATPGVPRYNARQSYNGFVSGATKNVAPLVQKNDYGVWYTGLQIMNLGPGSATVRVSYAGLRGSGTDTSCVPNTPVTGLTEPDFILNENESKTILTEFGGTLNSTALSGVDCFRGAATIEVISGTGKIATIISNAGQNRANTAIYRAFDPTVGTRTVSVPLIQKYLGGGGATRGWSTGIQIANVGGGSATITGTFNVTCGGTPYTIVDTATGVDPGSSVTFLQLNGFPVGSLGTRVNCLGSAVFTANQNIIGIVQQDFFGSPNPFTGDTLLAFEAFNQ